MIHRYARAALLFGFALLIAKLFVAGEMVKYMSPALDPLTALTGVALAVMGAVELRGARGEATERAAEGHEHGANSAEQALTSLLLLIPLMLGFLVTPRALGATALGGEEVASLLLSFGAGPARAEAQQQAPPVARIEDVPDLLRYLGQHGEAGVGQRVQVSGLVARSARLAPEELALVRFAIAHCVADARPVGLLVVAGRDGHGVDPAWAPDQWVRVEGTLESRERDGDRLVSIVAERITPIEEPNNPYLTAGL